LLEVTPPLLTGSQLLASLSTLTSLVAFMGLTSTASHVRSPARGQLRQGNQPNPFRPWSL